MGSTKNTNEPTPRPPPPTQHRQLTTGSACQCCVRILAAIEHMQNTTHRDCRCNALEELLEEVIEKLEHK